MKFERKIFKTPEFSSFYCELSDKIQNKFDYVMNVIATVYNIPTKFVKHLENTDLYEMRISIGSNEYRTIIFAIDHDNLIESKKIILINGFLKKDKKDYKRQIQIANKILEKFEL